HKSSSGGGNSGMPRNDDRLAALRTVEGPSAMRSLDLHPLAAFTAMKLHPLVRVSRRLKTVRTPPGRLGDVGDRLYQFVGVVRLGQIAIGPDPAGEVAGIVEVHSSQNQNRHIAVDPFHPFADFVAA